MMIPVKSLTLLLILLLVNGRFSTADPYQDGNLARGVQVVSTGEEKLGDMLAFRFGGRKSMVNHFKRPKTAVETKVSSTAGTRSSSENSNEYVAPRSDLEGKGWLKSDNQKGAAGRILLFDYSYVSYDDDYHAAMHHPPKNN